MNLEEFDLEDLKSMCAKYNIHGYERMSKEELIKALHQMTGTEIKEEKSIKTKSVNTFSSFILFMIFVVIFQLFTFIAPLVLAVSFNGTYSISNIYGETSVKLTSRGHDWIMLLIINLLSLAYSIYILNRYFKYGFFPAWGFINLLLGIGYWIYFMIGTGDYVSSLTQEIKNFQAVAPTTYSKEIMIYINLFWAMVAVSCFLGLGMAGTIAYRFWKYSK